MSQFTARFCDGVRHLYIPSLNDVSKCRDGGLRQWLALSDHFVPLPHTRDGLFELTFYDPAEVLSAWAGDIDRLSCAAIETMTNIFTPYPNKKFLAWDIINYYYTAFFSAHSILKILGFGLIQVDHKAINNVKYQNDVLGIAGSHIAGGMYCVYFEWSRNCIHFYKVNRYDDSHKGLWQRFSDCLGILEGILVETNSYDSNCIRLRNSGESIPKSVYSALPKQDAECVITRLDELRLLLNKTGDNNWLSHVRNMVNYSQGFGVWYPYKSYSDRYEKLEDMKRYCFRDPLDDIFHANSDSDLLSFVQGCQLVNAMNVDLLHDINMRHAKNKSFLRNGVISYMEHYSDLLSG